MKYSGWFIWRLAPTISRGAVSKKGGLNFLYARATFGAIGRAGISFDSPVLTEDMEVTEADCARGPGFQ